MSEDTWEEIERGRRAILSHQMPTKKRLRRSQAERWWEEEEKQINIVDHVIYGEPWPDLEEATFKNRGRGLVAVKSFKAGDVLCHYEGKLYTGKEAVSYEAKLDEEGKSTYAYKFRHQDQPALIDGSAESGDQGRLINHSPKHPNLRPKSAVVAGKLTILFYALKDINIGDEILYDYGQRANTKNQLPQWLNGPCVCRDCQSPALEEQEHCKTLHSH